MNMVGTNRKGGNFPIVFFGYIVEYFFQSVRHCILENRCPSFRAPYEMILHRVDGVTTSAVWFSVDWHHSINRASSVVFRREYPF